MIFGEKEAEKILRKIDFEKMDGLVPVTVQDYENNQVLMVAFANRTAVLKSLITGYAHFYSRSRKILWKKGETSGHVQKIREIYLDCDNDALIYKVDQILASCHDGYRTCFYQKLDLSGNWVVVYEKIFEPERTYGKRE